MKKHFLTAGLVAAIAGLGLTGCYNDTYEELYAGPGGGGGCDTNVTFSQTIQPILNTHCALSGCHKTGAAGSGWLLDNYEGAKAASGRIVGAINHSSGFSAMPKNGAMLPACERQQIARWIDQGTPNN